MEKKLEPIGPYTPEHEGPWVYVGLSIKKCDVHSVFGGVAFISVSGEEKPFTCPESHIRDAHEVSVAREFWVNEYVEGVFGRPQANYSDAERVARSAKCYIRTIRVREVLPEVADISPTVTDVPEMDLEKDQDGLLPVVAWEGRDFHSDYELGFSRDRDKDFLDEQPSSGEVAWHPLVRRSDALREIEELRRALREARASISSLVNAKPVAAASQGADGGGHAQ